MTDNVIHFYSIISKLDLTIDQMISLGHFMKVPSKYLYYLVR